MRHRAGLSRQRSRLASSKLIVFSSSRRIPPPGWSAPARTSGTLCKKAKSTRLRSIQTHRRRTRATPRPGTARAHGRAHATARQKRRVAVESARRRKGGACRPYGCGSSRADSAGVRTLSSLATDPHAATRYECYHNKKRETSGGWAYHRQHDHIARPELRRRHPSRPSIIPQQLCPIVREVTRLFHPCVVDVVHAVSCAHAREARERAASGTASSGQTGGGCILCQLVAAAWLNT